MTTIPLLDHGFVRLIDTMGSDSAIVQAARVSYGEGTKTPSDDKALIRYLVRHKHTSPLEMCEIKLHIKAPIFVARQWMRHRTGSFNEVSGRYSEMKDEFYVPAPEDMKAQSKANKQGRGDVIATPDSTAELIEVIRDQCYLQFAFYKSLLDDSNLARELARIVLPLSTFTEFYWKIDLHNLFHFLKLRTDPHAQREIQVYAEAIETIVRDWCPIAWEAWRDYSKEAVTLSADEVAVMRRMVAGRSDEIEAWLEKTDMSAREKVEFRVRFLV